MTRQRRRCAASCEKPQGRLAEGGGQPAKAAWAQPYGLPGQRTMEPVGLGTGRDREVGHTGFLGHAPTLCHITACFQGARGHNTRVKPQGDHGHQSPTMARQSWLGSSDGQPHPRKVSTTGRGQARVHGDPLRCALRLPGIQNHSTNKVYFLHQTGNLHRCLRAMRVPGWTSAAPTGTPIKPVATASAQTPPQAGTLEQDTPHPPPAGGLPPLSSTTSRPPTRGS